MLEAWDRKIRNYQAILTYSVTECGVIFLSSMLLWRLWQENCEVTSSLDYIVEYFLTVEKRKKSLAELIALLIEYMPSIFKFLGSIPRRA